MACYLSPHRTNLGEHHGIIPDSPQNKPRGDTCGQLPGSHRIFGGTRRKPGAVKPVTDPRNTLGYVQVHHHSLLEAASPETETPRTPLEAAYHGHL